MGKAQHAQWFILKHNWVRGSVQELRDDLGHALKDKRIAQFINVNVTDN